jgi:hypothetical protein
MIILLKNHKIAYDMLTIRARYAIFTTQNCVEKI